MIRKNVKQEQIQKERQLKVEESLLFILNDERGRFFMSEILGELTLCDTHAYTGDNDTFRNLGQQQVYTALKKRIEAVLGINGFNLWQKMEKEKYERRFEENERRQRV